MRLINFWEEVFHSKQNRFTKYNFRNQTGVSNRNSKQPCVPYSLPLAKDKYPICENDDERACYEQVIEELRSDQEKHCPRSCNVKEYKTRVDTSFILKTGSTPLTIELIFDSPKQTKDVRSVHPFKFVKTEYWVMSGMTLVGNVGGTLGMFIGFSFIGVSQWIMDLVNRKIHTPSVYRRHKKRTPVIDPNINLDLKLTQK